MTIFICQLPSNRPRSWLCLPIMSFVHPRILLPSHLKNLCMHHQFSIHRHRHTHTHFSEDQMSTLPPLNYLLRISVCNQVLNGNSYQEELGRGRTRWKIGRHWGGGSNRDPEIIMLHQNRGSSTQDCFSSTY